jgi:hypothetical protein
MLRAQMLTPGSAIAPHFHRRDQWQVVLKGDGRLGKQPLEALSLHYTDAFTPYGSIVAGERGLEFYDMYARCDPDGSYTNPMNMPASRALLERKARRNLVSQARPSDPRGLRSLPCPKLETLLEPLADGVAAFRLRCGPEARTSGPAPRGSSGQMYLVVGGAGSVAGVPLCPGTGFFLGGDEDPPEIASDVDGFDALVLQYPATD